MDVDRCGDNPNPVPYLGSPPPNVIRAGDMVTDLEGVLDYGQVNSGNSGQCYLPSEVFARDYRLHPVQSPTFTPVNTRTATPDSVGGSIKVGSFNVLNYFNGDGLGGGFPTSLGAGTLSEFDRQSDKIVDAIITLDADIVGLMELENDGFGANSAIQELVDRLNAVAVTGTYAFIDPGTPAIGADEITVGLIYQLGNVTPVGSAAILTRTSFTDPNGLGSQQNRPALAQTFESNANNERFTVVVNHLKSKGSACGPGDDDLTTGQGNCNGTRTAGVTDQVSWLATDPTGSGDPDFLILGDLNAYAQEDPIDEFISNGYTNLIDQYLGATAYSYVFDGQLGYLDHALASATMASQVTGVTEWHINADEPPVIDYDQDFNPPGYYSVDPYRSSDHDPVLIDLDLTPTAVTLARFEASLEDGTVLVEWETAMEIDNVGFNLYRGESPDGPYTRLNETLIPSQAPGAVFGAIYSWRDSDVQAGITYYYKLEDVEVGGACALHGPVSVSVQTPTRISLVSVQARGSPHIAAMSVGIVIVLAILVGHRAKRIK